MEALSAGTTYVLVHALRENSSKVLKLQGQKDLNENTNSRGGTKNHLIVLERRSVKIQANKYFEETSVPFLEVFLRKSFQSVKKVSKK